MKAHEYGAQHAETILLLHGGGLSWWNYREAAELLQDEYHVILPILDGHAGSDRPFTSIEDNAAEILAWLDESCGGSAALIGGLSLGGQVALEMLSQRGDLCRHALIESASVIPDPLTGALIAPAFGSSYGLIRNRRFARLQFQSLRLKEELFEDYYRDSCAIAKADMIAFLKASTAYSPKIAPGACRASVHIFAGARETRQILRSAGRLHEALPGSSLAILPGLYHGEFSIRHPEDYADTLRRILKGR